MSDSATPWTAARQAALPFTTPWSLLRFLSFESVTLSNHPIHCCPLLLLPAIPYEHVCVQISSFYKGLLGAYSMQPDFILTKLITSATRSHSEVLRKICSSTY